MTWFRWISARFISISSRFRPVSKPKEPRKGCFGAKCSPKRLPPTADALLTLGGTVLGRRRARGINAICLCPCAAGSNTHRNLDFRRSPPIFTTIFKFSALNPSHHLDFPLFPLEIPVTTYMFPSKPLLEAICQALPGTQACRGGWSLSKTRIPSDSSSCQTYPLRLTIHTCVSNVRQIICYQVK